MSRKTRNIFIIGSKLEHFECIESYFIEKTAKFFQYKFYYGTWEDLYSQAETTNFCSIFIDFSLTKSAELFVQCFNKIKFFKNTEQFQKIPIAGFFDEKNIVLENSYILKSGINYFHMIGDDLSLFFGNFYYLAFEDEDYCLKLSRANKLEVRTSLEHNFYISRINSFSARIEGDLDIDEEFSASITNSFEAKKLQMEQTDQLASCEITSDLNCFDVEFSFESEWGETEGAEPIYEDEVINWIGNLESDGELEETQQLCVHLYSESISWALSLVNESELNGVQPRLFSKFNESELEQFSEPEFIICDCITSDQLDDVDTIMTYYSNQSVQPVILLRNHPSKTDAIQKMYEYESVISYGNKFCHIEFNKMVQMLRLNKKIEKSNRFKIESNNFMLQFSLDTIVTSMSENEITFKTQHEIPFFSHLVLRVEDLHVYLTIIPPYFDLSPNIGGFHYLAIINFCEESERQILRKSVRRFVGNHPDSWEGVELISEDEDFGPTGEEEKIEEVLVTNTIKKKNKEEDLSKQSSQVNRIRTKGQKSKL